MKLHCYIFLLSAIVTLSLGNDESKCTAFEACKEKRNVEKWVTIEFSTIKNGINSETKSFTIQKFKDGKNSIKEQLEEETYGFDASLETKILAHDWGKEGFVLTTNFCNDYIEAYKSAEMNLNIFCIDWYKTWTDWVGGFWGTETLFTRLAARELPEQVAYSSYIVGKRVGHHIVRDLIVERLGQSLDKIHAIGYGYGSTVAAIASRNSGGLIGRITGLDPMRDGYLGKKFLGKSISFKDKKLKKSDADLVDVIHTNTDKYGMESSIGHFDFFPNGGEIQPGCDNGNYCSHKRASEYYIESIENSGNDLFYFSAKRCNSWSEYQNGNCETKCTVQMGEFLNKDIFGRTCNNLEGDYFLEVENEAE